MSVPAEESSKQKLSALVLLISLVFILDQLTKALAIKELEPHGSIPVIPSFFSLTFVKNKGAAFGMFGGLPTPYREISLAVVSLFALGFVVHLMLTDAREDRLAKLSLALIIGGAFGNLVDRARFGAVVDFLDFYWHQYHFPAFNVADSAISVGVALLLLKMWRPKETPAPAPA